MPNLLNPDRISLARKRRGHTRASLSRELGVSSRTAENYEIDGAPLNCAPKLAAILDFPAPFFGLPGAPEIETDTVNFRAGRNTTRKNRDAAEAAGAFGVEIAHWVGERFILPRLNLPAFTHETPHMAAQMLRDYWGLGVKPLPNLVQLSESKGIHVFGLPSLAMSVDAFSFFHKTQPFVFLARHKTPERARFDLAHELGHLVMHKHSCAESAAQQEQEANQFASAFLLPDSMLAEYMPHNAKVDDILYAKDAFKVSAMALTYTLHKNGRMTDWIYRTTCAELTKRGFQKGEPGGMSTYEMSKVYPQVYAADKSGPVTVERVARELSLPEDDVNILTFGTKLRVIEGGSTNSRNEAKTVSIRKHLSAVK